MRTEMEAPEPMMGSWLPCKGLAMVYAQTGTGKSVFCISVALSVAAGQGLFDWKPSTPKRVLYIDGELPQEYLQEMVERVARGLDIELDDNLAFWFVTIDQQPGNLSPNLDAMVDQAALQRIIEENHIDLIVADNISTLSGAEFGENEAASWEGMQSWALLQRSQGRTVVFVHHAGKSGAQRGTSKREDVLDSTLKLMRRGDGEEGFKLDFDKHRRGPKPEAMSVAFINHDDRVELAVEVAKSTEIEIAECWENGMSADAIASDLGLSRRSVYYRLNALWNEGKLERPLQPRGGRK